MDAASWQTASADVKQSIIAQADPLTVRNFCQADRNSREICRDRLPAVVKYRSCLDSAESAQACDKIPMFSQQQFLTVVPKTITMYPNETVQTTHEFYSQNYKLPTEGFATALRKAKLMNTICALARPDFLLSKEATALPIPAYVDASTLDYIVRLYSSALDKENLYMIRLEINLYDSRRQHVSIVLMYKYDWVDGQRRSGLDVLYSKFYMTPISPIRKIVLADAIGADPFMDYIRTYWQRTRDRYIDFLPFSEPATPTLHVFHLSRLLKAAFDQGYFHEVRVEITINHGVGEIITI